jgi:hypothetical protein
MYKAAKLPRCSPSSIIRGIPQQAKQRLKTQSIADNMIHVRLNFIEIIETHANDRLHLAPQKHIAMALHHILQQ